jgi:hypothetical protein
MDGQLPFGEFLPSHQFDEFVLALHEQLLSDQFELSRHELTTLILQEHLVEEYDDLFIVEIDPRDHQCAAPVVHLLRIHRDVQLLGLVDGCLELMR